MSASRGKKGKRAKASNKGERRGPSGTPRRAAMRPRSRDPRWLPLALLVGLSWLAFRVYQPAMYGQFISDDLLYITMNPYIQALSLDNLVVLLDPGGAAAVATMNYAPVHLLGHAFEWAAFGTSVHGYHVVNVWLHIAVSALCFLFLRTLALPTFAAGFAAALFLLHPANVEAVAWIFQLKTILSTGLGLAAILLFSRHPLASLALFALGLLTKISAAFALPVVAVALYCRSGKLAEAEPGGAVNAVAGDGARQWRWLVAWVVVFVVVALPVLHSIDRTPLGAAEIHPEGLAHARTIVAIAMRYLAMAATSYGVSAFQHLTPSVSWLEPWWIAGALVLACLGYRWVACLLRRDGEAIAWTLAIASFIPVSQIVPFPYPIADHYLYPILPGLIGGALIATGKGASRLDAYLGDWPPYARVQQWLGSSLLSLRVASPASQGGSPGLFAVAGCVLGVIVCVGFSVRSQQRAGVWVSMREVMDDSARHHPDGVQAHMLASFEAAKAGDAELSAAALRRAFERGYHTFGEVHGNPTYASVSRHPAFESVLEDMARWWIEREKVVRDPTAEELRGFSQSYHLLGDLDLAIRRLEEALELGGPGADGVAAELDQLRLEKRIAERLVTPPSEQAPSR